MAGSVPLSWFEETSKFNKLIAELASGENKAGGMEPFREFCRKEIVKYAMDRPASGEKKLAGIEPVSPQPEKEYVREPR